MRRLTVPSSTLGRAAVLALTIQVAATAARYVVQVIFARSGGVREYGLYAFAISWAQMLSIPATFGLSVSVLRFIPTYVHEHRWSLVRGVLRRSIEVTIASSAIMALGGTLLVILVGGSPDVQQTLLLGFALLPLMALVLLKRELMRGSQNVLAAYGLSDLLPAVLILGAGAGLALTRPLTGIQMLAITGAGLLLTLAVQHFGVRRLLAPAFSAGPPQFATSLWLRVSLPLFAVSVLSQIMNRADIVFVGVIRGTDDAGFYSAAVRTAVLVGFIVNATSAVLAPMLAATHASGDRERLERLVRSAVRISFLPTLCIVIPLILFAEPILRTFGPQFAEATGALRLLAVAALVSAATGPIGYLLGVTGHEKSLLGVSAVTAVAGVVLYLLLIPPLGIIGAAMSSATTTVMLSVWLYIIVRVRLRIRAFGVF